MTLQQLKYVITVAETGTITEAANRLFISQPSLTNAIHELEKEMNIVIFNRTNKGISLSKEGEGFLGYARQVLEQAAILEDKYKRNGGGKKQFCVSTQHYSFAVNAFVDLMIQDISVAYQEVIKQFYDAGCRNLQFDDCTWGAIVGDAAKQRYQAVGIDLEDVKAQLLAVNNLALEGRPDDMVITSHICRGNYHSTYFASGPYDTVADYVFAKENVDALFLEYDDERSGGFAPLEKVSEDKKVVLGLITTKSPVLEDKEKVIARIYEAAKYVPLDRLYLSPQCGFASCEIGNKLTEEEQWAKLRLVKEIAEEVWKN